MQIFKVLDTFLFHKSSKPLKFKKLKGEDFKLQSSVIYFYRGSNHYSYNTPNCIFSYAFTIKGHKRKVWSIYGKI